ncbi:MAG: hypothetical protein IT462_06205 [Planctomycetes bacterium]|nr:hypothetical protein [Planctomycetota bacterium]
MHRFLLIAITLFFANSLAALTITGDIITNTTWTSSDSPITLDPAGASGGTVKVRNGATLTIDSTGGVVNINWNEDCDFQIGNGSGDGGDLVIKAASGAINFKAKAGGNIRINPYGSINFSDTTAETHFQQNGAGVTWGAMIFEAGQTKQSSLKNCDFSRAGDDGRDGALVIEDNDIVPTLDDVDFNTGITTSCMRLEGKGINVLARGNVTAPIGLDGATYAFFLNAVTSTAEFIDFPDPTDLTTQLVRMDGTCQVGSATNASHWRFDDGYTFKCSASSKLQVINGSVWGTPESRPLFQAISGTSDTHWVGLADDYTATATPKTNVWGDIGPFAYLEIRNASTGININKDDNDGGTTYFVPYSGQQTRWRFPGLLIQQCYTGIYTRTHIDGSGNGYTVVFEDCTLGSTAAGDDCDTACCTVESGRVEFLNCAIQGAVNTGIQIGAGTAFANDVLIRDSKITDNSGTTGIYIGSSQASTSVRIERSVIEGWNTGIYSVEASYSPARALILSHCFVSALNGTNCTALSVQFQTAAVCTLLVEDCTIAGVSGGTTNRGVWLQEIRNETGATATFRRTTIDGNGTYGIDVGSDSDNTIDYLFDQCAITTNATGVNDQRSSGSAKTIVQYSTFAGNTTNNAVDGGGTQILAQHCYWGAATPSGTSNTDTTNYYARPYIGVLTGGSPAAPSSWDVWESSSVQADNLHVISNTPYFKWTFASDFGSQTQGSYEVDIDNNSDFSSLHDNGSEQSNANSGFTYGGTALVNGTVYYARVRLEDASGRSGGWRYLTFQMNSAPGQVGNTNRSPSSGASGQAPATLLQWERPSDADEDPLHFKIEIDDNSSFNNGSGKYRSLTTNQYLGNGGYAEVSYDSGTTWIAFPSDGVTLIGGTTPRVRLYLPTTYPNGLGALIGGTWYWRVKATDGFEEGTASSNYTFSTNSGFVISGTLNEGGIGGSVTVGICRNGVKLAESDTTGGGSFSITVASVALSAGDTLVIFIDDETEDGATVLQFTGQDMDEASGLHEETELVAGMVIIDHRFGTAFTNAAFAADSGIDSDIPWSETSGAVDFDQNDVTTVEVRGSWNFSGTVDSAGTTVQTKGATQYSPETGTLTTCGYAWTAGGIDNDGSLEISGGSVVTYTSNLTSAGTFVVRTSTMTVNSSSADYILVTDGLFEATDSTFNANSTYDGRIVIDSSGAGSAARLACTDCTFSRWSITIETDGILDIFDRNTFQTNISTYQSNSHIYWKTTDSRSATTMRGIQFDYALTVGSQYNVHADSGSTVRTLTMIGCGGQCTGDRYESDSGSKVSWGLVPPIDVKVLIGDTRLRLEWANDSQADAGTNGSGTASSVTSTVLTVGGSPWTTNAFVNFTLRMGSDVATYKYYKIASNTSNTITIDNTNGENLVTDGWTTGSDYLVTSAGYNIYRSTNGTDFTKLAGVIRGTAYHDTGLSNGSTYYYYVKAADLNPSTDLESGQSKRVSAKPAAPTLALFPANAKQTSIVALTTIGTYTHWENSTNLTVGSNITVNDQIVLSEKLVLWDLTLSGASTGGRTFTTTENNVWGIAAYDETASATFTVDQDTDLTNRPSVSFTGPSADANVAASSSDTDITVSLSFSANGGAAISTGTFEFYADRPVWNDTADINAGATLAGVFDSVSSSAASWTVEQEITTAKQNLYDGEYTLYARIANSNGLYSEWVSRRVYVNGAGSAFVKVSDAGGQPVYLKQGDVNRTISLAGTGLSNSPLPDFGNNITVHSASVTGGGNGLDVVVSVDHLADCGPREFTTNSGSKKGQVIVDYPTNILPTTTNTEPSRNPAIGGVNVFLHSGAFFKSETDITTRGRMMGISWSRFYRSDITYNGPLGFNWVGHYYQRAIYDSSSSDIWWYTPDGRKEVFPDVTGGFSSPIGVYVTATRETTYNTITLTDRHGFKCVFNSQGRLWKCIDRNSNTTECSYNYAGQLSLITDDRSKTYEIVYASHGRVDVVKDKVWSTGSPREVEYEYNSSGDLIEQKAPKTNRYGGASAPYARITYAYVYDSAHRMTACVNPREFAETGTTLPYLENQYDSGKVVAQRLGELDQWLYVRYVSGTSVRVIDRRGLRTDYTLDASGRATTIARYTKFWSVDTDLNINHSTITEVSGKVRTSDPTSFNTVFTYNSNHEILTVTYPRGNKATYTYASGSSQTSGTATSCTTNKLSKFLAGWTNGAFIGMTLRMGTNPSNYKYYLIIDNDSNDIWVDETFDLQADGWGASAYNVFNQSSDPMAAGNVLTVTRSDEGLGSESDIITTYTYEPRYQFVKTVKNPRNYTTTYTYDYEESESTTDKFAGNLVMASAPSVTLGQPSAQTIESRTTYNQYGQPISSVDGEGNVTHFRYYSGSGHDGFLYQTVSGYGSLDLTSEFDYDNVGNMIASWPARAFETGATKDDFKSSYDVNELDQAWHSSGPELFTDGQTDRLDVYRYFDANGNVTHSFREYVTDAGSEPSMPGSPETAAPSAFSKSSAAMAATWVESTTVYNLLNYPTQRTVDAVAGSTVTRLTGRTEYDANYNVVASISPLGNRSATVYDERDMVFQSIAGANSDVQGIFESDYDANGNLSESRDALVNKTLYTYDGFDRTTLVTDPAGNERKSYYDANSNVTKSEAYWGTAAAGQLLTRSESFFDEIDRAYQSRRMANDYLGTAIGDGYATNTVLFDKNSRVARTTDDNGVTFYRFYDAANRTSYTRDAVGNEVHFEYNLDGANTKTTFREINSLDSSVEVSHEETDYDNLNRRTKFRDRRYNATSKDTEIDWKYDGWGRVTQTTDAAGTTTDYIFDLLSRSVRTTRKPNATEANWIITDNIFDDDSRVTRRTIWETGDDTTPTNPQDTDYTYDERSRLITLRRPDGDIWTYRYDANSNRIGWTDPLGTSVTDTFDNRNLISYRMITRGTGIKGATYESYEFDALGRLTGNSNYNGSNLISSASWRYNSFSMPESMTETIAKSDGTLLGTYTTGAEYDAAGLLRATIYSTGRRVAHSYDALNRLSESVDETNNFHIASYLYAGPHRLVHRVMGGNGAKPIHTKYEYEASGCGCGGFSSYCEKVEHYVSQTSFDEVVASNDRRYDKVGNVTAERSAHEGDMGKVYRYDNAYRLTETYFGVDLNDETDFTDFANDTDDPAAFAVKRSFALDTRGNRSGGSGIVDSDDASGTIKSTGFTVGGTGTQAEINARLMNVYTVVDGNDDYIYDAAEQLTYDASTGLYHAYDYKGQLVLTDNDADLATPERLYSYDCQGRRKTEEIWYEASYHLDSITSFITLCEQCTTCPCNACGQTDGEDVNYDSAGAAQAVTQSTFGEGATAGGSAQTVAPGTGAAASGGHSPGPANVAEYVAPTSGSAFWRLRGEDQLGSLRVVFNASGFCTDLYTYGPNGEPFRSKVMFHGRDDVISSLQADTPTTGRTNINLTGVTLTTDEMIACELVIPGPVGTSDYLSARVADNSTNWIELLDVGGASAPVYAALNGLNQGFFVLEFKDDVTFVDNGGIAVAPTYSAPYTTFTSYDYLAFTTADIGRYIQPDVGGSWWEIVAVDTGEGYWCKVVGDHSAEAQQNDLYTVVEYPPLLGYSNGGTWSSAPSYASNETTFTDSSHPYKTYMEGWPMLANILQPTPLNLTYAHASNYTVKVAGDADQLASSGDTYRIAPPPGVNLATGALATYTNGSLGDNTTADPGSRLLWCGYRYDPPMVGVYVNPPSTPPLGIYGCQEGPDGYAPAWMQGGSGSDTDGCGNVLGTYYCWNRVYSPYLGRWTTPDPAASPFWNLWDYCVNAPTCLADPTGLETEAEKDRAALEKEQVRREKAGGPPFKDGEVIEVDGRKITVKLVDKSGMSAEGKARIEAEKKAAEAAEKKTKEREGRSWGSGQTSKGNCWRYASDQPVDFRNAMGPITYEQWLKSVHQVGPGQVAGSWDRTVAGLKQELKDYGATEPNAKGECPEGTWKIAAVVGEKTNADGTKRKDMHFYRQEKDGTWKHKIGDGAVHDTDSSGAKITNPQTCNKNYAPAGHNYNEWAGYWCVK